MPSRLHRTSRDRPTLLDRWLAHPYEAATVAGVWSMLGFLLCWSWIDPGGGPVTILSRMAAWAAGAVAVSLLVSGLGVLTAIVWPGKDSTAWLIEIIALPLGIAAWLSYGVVAHSPFWTVIAAGYVAGGTVRWVAAWLNMRRPATAIVVITEG